MRTRLALLTLFAALLGAGAASAGTSSDFAGPHVQVLPVVVVRGLTLADIPGLAQRGAVGLLVPNAGPRTSASDAFAGMVRGILYNTRLPKPNDAVLIHVTKSDVIPRGPAIVIGLPRARVTPNTHRYPIAVIGPGYSGVLDSSLTRVTGLVSMADVARTALATPHALTSHADTNASGTIKGLETHIVTARSSTLPATVLLLALLAAFALFLPRGAPGALVTALVANVALGFLPQGQAAPRIALLGLAIVAGGLLFRRIGGWTYAAVLAAYALAMLVYPASLSLAPLGPELTSRFFGVANLLETLLLVPSLAGAYLLGRRHGPLAFGAVALLALTTIAENRLGSDGGGAIVLGVGYAVLAVLMLRARLRWILPALGVAAAAVFVLVDLDAAGSSPDHLRGALDNGLNGFLHVLANRVPLAYDRMLEQWWLLFPLAFALAVGIATVRRTPVIGALLAALAASFLINDSPGAVALMALPAVLALEGGAVHRSVMLPVWSLRPARATT
jgi:hypothetical protein